MVIAKPYDYTPAAVTLTQAENDTERNRLLNDPTVKLLNDPHLSDREKAKAIREFKNITKGAEDAQALFDSIQNGDSFLQKQIEQRPHVIKNMFKAKQIMMLSASSKVGKTWLATRLGLCVSQGRPWLGMETVKTKTLFFNFELGEDDMQHRLTTLYKQEMPGVVIDTFNVINLRESKIKGARLLQALPDFGKKLKEAGYGLVIIDPIYQMYGAGTDENSAGDILAVMELLNNLTLDADVAVVFSHHFSKGSQAKKDAMDCFSGSGVFFRYVNCSMAVRALEDNDANESYVVDIRQGSFPPIKPFGVKIKGPTVILDNSLNLKAIKDPGKYKSAFSANDILKAIVSEPMTANDLRITVMKSCGMGESTFYRLWRDVKNHPGVSEDQDGKWVYNPPGTITGNSLTEGNSTGTSNTI